MKLKFCGLSEEAEKLQAGRAVGYVMNESNKVLQKDYVENTIKKERRKWKINLY